MLTCAFVLAACQTTAGSSACDGWRKLTPAAATARYVVKTDRRFAEQVAGHNRFGQGRGCWE